MFSLKYSSFWQYLETVQINMVSYTSTCSSNSIFPAMIVISDSNTRISHNLINLRYSLKGRSSFEALCDLFELVDVSSDSKHLW